MAKDKNLEDKKSKGSFSSAAGTGGSIPEIDLEKYNNEDTVSLRAMEFGLWLARNRQKIKKTIIGFLFAVCAFFFIFSAYGLFNYFLAGDPNKQVTTNNLLLSPRNMTIKLEAAAPEIFKSDGHYDLAAKVRNPNDNFSSTFKYCFRQDGYDVACGEAFIFPEEEKYILALARDLDLDKGTAGVSFAISDISWRRLDARRIPDWARYAAERLNFSVSDLKFTSAERSDLSEKVALNSLEFSIKNETPYGYYEAPLNILFYSGGSLVGVNRYLLVDFLSGENRNINLIWPGNLRGVNRTEVVPDINIMDEGVYLKYRGEVKK
jgi:hypothetical protein